MLKLVTFVLIIALTLAKDCPAPESIAPCTCETERDFSNLKNIYCGGSEEINLRRVFKNISLQLPQSWDRIFYTFYLNNTKVHELPENLFTDSTFDRIIIQDAYNLTRVHSNAFNGTTDVLEVVASYNTPLDNNGPDYDLFKALNSLPELGTVLLSNTSLRHIPDNAFGPLNRVLYVEIINGSLESVGKHAFKQLGNVRNILLGSNKITNISEGALALEGPRDWLTIDLSGNELTNTNLNLEIFAGLNSTSTSLNITGNPLTYLAEDIFSTYLDNDEFNHIFADNLDCTDCRNYWLVEKHRTFAGVTLKCSDHVNIADQRHFGNCTTF